MEKAILFNANAVELGERRKSERVELLVRVTYQSIDELFSEFARNINEGGVFIETDSPQEPGSAVGLQFKLPGSDELVEVMGTVVRTTDGSVEGESAGMGIEFGELNANARQRINELIRGLRSGG